MEFNIILNRITIKIIEDLLIYPEERKISQPEIYLEIDESSNKEKAILLCDDFEGNVIVVTPD